MQDESRVSRNTGINTVEDLNEVLNDVWHGLGSHHDYAFTVIECFWQTKTEQISG